jgi:hypothetical protein
MARVLLLFAPLADGAIGIVKGDRQLSHHFHTGSRKSGLASFHLFGSSTLCMLEREENNGRQEGFKDNVFRKMCL